MEQVKTRKDLATYKWDTSGYTVVPKGMNPAELFMFLITELSRKK